ncbi:MAG: cytochrome c oxidase subunit I [Chloroflexi bacterium]|nr:cytochrome c oxidase subunit I [Chloroflexota bacterium]
MATMSQSLPGVLRRPTGVDGVWGWITTVDAKRIGIMYGVSALLFLIAGGIEAMIIRVQLAQPDQSIVAPETYNQLFTMHGTTMIFLVIMPLNAAFFNFIVPLMIGARDVAFPRLNALSFWVFLAGGIFLHVSFLAGGAADAGWFSYANLTERPFSATRGIDYWILSLALLGFSSTVASINFITTIINMRAKGMTFMRMPVFVWMTLIVSFLLLLALPVITVALILLLVDRIGGSSFFVTSGGGDPVLWQHLFWIFGHPEVYVLILPAMGVVSEILPVFSRKPLFGYRMIVLAGVIIAVLGFAVWSHHMFAVGLGPIANGYFATATMVIAIPTGVKIFNWIATLWRGQLSFPTPMLFALAFIALFTVGGLSGIMHASPPTDLQQTDTYFIVAHLHYVLFGGSMFGLMGGIYYWFPKVTGRMLNDGLGKLHFWVMFIGANLAFFPMHFVGLGGMPRRVFTYAEELGLGDLNLLVSIGAFIMGGSFLFLVVNIFKSLKNGKIAGDDPWDGHTLEWTTASPPPLHNFDELPEVRSVRPLWDEKHPEAAENPPPPKVDPTQRRQRHIHLPSPSYWPLVLAIGTMVSFFGILYVHEGGVPAIIIGVLIAFIATMAWVMEPVTADEGHH